MKKIIALVLATILCAFAFVSCGDKDKSEVAEIKENGKIVIGVTVYQPMDYLDDDGNWTGFDAELAQMFAEDLGVTCQLVIIDWNNKVAELKSGNIDLIWNGMTATDELAKNMDFSVSYAKNAQVAVVAKNSTLTAANVKNATVAVENGSAGETAARDLGVADSKLIEKSDGQVGALSEVLSGNAQVAIIDITMAQSVVGKGIYGDLKILDGASYGDEIFAVGIRKDSDLKKELDKFLKEKYEDGTLEALAIKYSVGLNTEALED